MQGSCLEQGAETRVRQEVKSGGSARSYRNPEPGEHGRQSVMGLGVSGGGGVKVRREDRSPGGREGERVGEEV